MRNDVAMHHVRQLPTFESLRKHKHVLRTVPSPQKYQTGLHVPSLRNRGISKTQKTSVNEIH